MLVTEGNIVKKLQVLHFFNNMEQPHNHLKGVLSLTQEFVYNKNDEQLMINN